MKRLTKALSILLPIFGFLSVNDALAASVYFDVANAPDYSISLSPVYTGNANSILTATSLTAHGVNPSSDCCIGGPGDFIFTNWQVKENPLDYNKYLEFGVTALSPVSFQTLQFSGFGGIYSNMGGPRTAFVRASNDGFVSNTTQYWSGAYWNLTQTSPYITDSPNDYTYDVSNLGTLDAGQTLLFRFYFANTDYGSIPGGFWNKSTNDYNPTLTLATAAVPVPAAIWLFLSALTGLSYFANKHRRK